MAKGVIITLTGGSMEEETHIGCCLSVMVAIMGCTFGMFAIVFFSAIRFSMSVEGTYRAMSIDGMFWANFDGGAWFHNRNEHSNNEH